jgi:hypothetical protein
MTRRPFMFVTPMTGQSHGFRLMVLAVSERAARQYVKNQSASRAHRGLVFAGAGAPPEGERDCWVAAVAEGAT